MKGLREEHHVPQERGTSCIPRKEEHHVPPGKRNIMYPQERGTSCTPMSPVCFVLVKGTLEEIVNFYWGAFLRHQGNDQGAWMQPPLSPLWSIRPDDIFIYIFLIGRGLVLHISRWHVLYFCFNLDSPCLTCTHCVCLKIWNKIK